MAPRVGGRGRGSARARGRGHDESDVEDGGDSEEEEEDESKSSSDASAEGDAYAVKRILKSRGSGNDEEFLVIWKGRDPAGDKWENSWEPLSSLTDCEWLVQQFRQLQSNSKKRKAPTGRPTLRRTVATSLRSATTRRRK